MSSFVHVASERDFWNGEMRGLVVRGQRVLLVRLDGSMYAYPDRCAHQGVLLSAGSLEGCVLTCSAHRWQYDLCTGRGVNPGSAELHPFAVRVENGEVFVNVDEAPV